MTDQTQENSGLLGYLLWYSIPAMTISYDEVSALAAAVGFSDDFIPRAGKEIPQARSAWEKATNLGARGIVVKPSLEVRSNLFNQYGVEPTIRLKAEKVGGKRPYLKRQLICVVTIPNVDSDDSQSGRSLKNAEKQLTFKRVCMMEFDTETGTAKWITLPQSDPLVDSVKNEIDDTIDQMHQDYKMYKSHCDDQRLREGVRQWLNSEHSLNARPTSAQGGGGGVYFIPANKGAEERIEAARKYITGLNTYVLGSSDKAQEQAKAGLQVLPAFKAGNMFSPAFAEEMKEQSVIQIKAEINAVIASLGDLKESKGKHRKNKAVGLLASAKHLSRSVAMYQEAFEDELSVIDLAAQKLLKRAQKALDEAQDTSSG